jgi:DNA polymerase elongation subunit (family B)
MNATLMEMFVYQWFADVDKFYNTVIRIYGITNKHTSIGIQQKNVCLKITNFKPYCFVEIPDSLYENINAVRTHISKFFTSYEVVEKLHLYNSYNKHIIQEDGLTKNETLFIKVYFKNKKNMQNMMFFLQGNDVLINGRQHKLSVHENNANPVLQLICNSNIDSVGWLDFSSARRVDEEEKETTCDEEYTVLWQQLKKGKNVCNIQPKTLAFDMEVTSSIPSAFPSDKPKDEIFQISCVIVENDTTRRLLLTLEPKNDKQQVVETLVKENITTYMFASETDLLENFIKIINDERPNIITGYNIFGFDIQYLIKRCSRFLLTEQLKMAGFYKNAFAKEEEIKWSSSAYKNQNFRFINWEGILLVDLLPIIQRDYKLDTYSLKNVSSTFLKNNTKDPVTHKDIFEAFNTRDSVLLTTVGKYCVQDSALCIDLMNHLHTWVHLCEMARCCNVPIFTIFTQGQQIRLYSQIYKFCTNNNTVVTTNGYDAKTNERYRGALVHEPKPGFYKNVCPLDFASLYPSIIIGYNLCYSTYIPDNCVLPEEYYNVFEWEDHVGCVHDENVIKIKEITNKIEVLETQITKLRNDIKSVSTTELKAKKMTKTAYRSIIQEKINLLVLQKKPFLEFRQKLKKNEPKRIEDDQGNKIEGIMCAKRRYRFLKPHIFKGIVPTIIQNLLDSRNEIKNQLKACQEEQKIILNMQQLSYKVSANSFYGSFGVTRGYLPFMPCAMTITFCGRKAITNVIDLAVNKFSAQLVMSDTDSTYLIFPGKFGSCEKLWNHAEYVADQITNYKKNNGSRMFPEAVKLEFENIIYSKFLIVAKKMYLYKSVDSTGVESEKIGKKGVVLARRDNSQIVRNVYERITNFIFDSTSVSDLMCFLEQYIFDMYDKVFPITDFVITKSVGDIEEDDDQKNCKGRLGNYKIRNMLPTDEKEKQKILNGMNERDYYILQCPPQVQLAERLQRRGTPVSTGSRLEFVVLNHPTSSSLGKKFECFEYFQKHQDILDLDYHYYAEAMINPVTQLINAVSETDDNKVSVLIKQIIAEKKL